METRFETFIELKDAIISPYAVVAVGKVTIPATMQTPEYYANSVFLRDVHEPIVVTYEDVAERDAEYKIILDSVNAL